MVKPISQTPGFTQISPSVIQQDADVSKTIDQIETNSLPPAGSQEQAQPPVPGRESEGLDLGELRGTKNDVNGLEVSQPVATVDPQVRVEASELTPQADAVDIPEIPSLDSVLDGLVGDSEPDFDEVDPAIAGIDLSDRETQNPPAPIPELEGYETVLPKLTKEERPANTADLTVSPGASSYGLKKSELPAVTSYIQQKAMALGIDPEIAVRVAKSEGLGAGVWQSRYRKGGYREPSYGPFQLLKGGKGTGFPEGMGNDFQRKTGLDPADPKNLKKTIDFALEWAKNNGWSAWYGAKKVGVSRWSGISRG